MGFRAIHLNEAAAMMINTVCEEFETWRQTLPESAVPKLEELTRPAGAGRAVRVTVETPARIAEATVWESGEADLVIGNLATGDIEASEHTELDDTPRRPRPAGRHGPGGRSWQLK